MTRLLVLLFSTALLAACGQSAAPPSGPAAPAADAATPAQYVGQTLTNPIVNADGNEIGRATLTEGPHGVFIRLDFNDSALMPGWHGLHFHAVATCDDAAAGFTASGAHVGHVEGRHGLLNPTGPEPGDLPSIFAPDRGAFGAELYTAALRLSPGDGARAQVLDADGTALIIHAAHDDQVAQPIGGAGARAACAAFNAG